MKLTTEDIITCVDQIESELFNATKIKFTFDKFWSSNFPAKAGIYAIFDNNKLVYVGETANIKERMKEVKRTVNHSFRKKLGKYLEPNAKVQGSKYPEALEQKLNTYFTNNLYFTSTEVNFGRLEIESYLIHRHCKNGLLNSIGKRNRIDSKV